MGQNVGQGRLTVKMVRAINAPGLYGDGNTLFLRVAPGGSKQWVQRLTVRGKRRDIGLGGCGWVTLAQAREAAWENRRVARNGGDPLAEKRRATVPTFREAAERTYETLRPRWRNKQVAKNWMQQLERHALKRLGPIPVDRDRAGGCPGGTDAHLEHQARNGPARAPAHPGHAEVVSGSRVRRGECRG